MRSMEYDISPSNRLIVKLDFYDFMIYNFWLGKRLIDKLMTDGKI